MTEGTIRGAEGGRQDMEQQGMEGGVVCEKCGATFETQEELDRHIQEAHKDDDGMQN